MPTNPYFSNSFSSYFMSNQECNIKLIFAELCTDQDLSNITYFAWNLPSDISDDTILISTYPEAWISHYFDHNYQDFDPVLAAGSTSILPVDWTDLKIDDAFGKQFFGEAREFGIGAAGLTIPVRGLYGEEALLSINSGRDRTDWKAYCKLSISDLTYFAHLVHNRVIDRRKKDDSSRRIILSRREQQVLQWAARGKTAWETARILKLQEKTIAFYLANACSKLEVVTKTQAVAVAVKERLILIN